MSLHSVILLRIVMATNPYMVSQIQFLVQKLKYLEIYHY
jgi:hypothetical protein